MDATQRAPPGYDFDVENLKYVNVSAVAPEVTKHLVRVYSSLALTTLCAVLGAFVYQYFPIHPIISIVVACACIIAITWGPEITEKDFLAIEKQSDRLRNFALLLVFGFFEGASLGGLIKYTLELDPSIVLVAFVGTLLVFGCLTASALLAKRKSYLFLGGFLASALSNLLFLGLLNIFLQIEFLQLVSLYGGLVMFCGYVLYDSQVIVEKVNQGSRDHVRHAATLFIDLVNIFVRILIILAKNSKKR